MRYRTRNSFSYGSTWMSLAPFWMADISTTFTSLMTGASPPCFSSDSALISSRSSSTSTSSLPAVISAIDWVASSSALLPPPTNPLPTPPPAASLGLASA